TSRPSARPSAMQLEGWNVIDEDAAIVWREYPFAKGARATALAFRGAGGMVGISPPAKLEPRALDALAELGPVRALVAHNAYHHLGQREWRARFPDAESFCPPGAIAVLEKKVAGAKFRSLAELALPDHARWEDAPGLKTGETIVRLASKRGPVWYAGDLLA